MSHSNSTQYYSLPQFDSTDKPAWLVDVNPAYAAIDAGIHAAKAAADAAQGDATQALTDASAAGTAASAADAKGAGSIASLADAFDATATYNIGDLVIYNNLLYICIVAVTVPGAWTGSGNWNRTTFDEVTGNIADTVSNLEIQDLANVTLTTSDNNKLLRASVSGSDIEVDTVNDPMIFSTTEKVVGKWIDNKPIYQKTISADVSNNEVVLTGVDTLISVNGSGNMPGTVTRVLPFIEMDGAYPYILTFRLTSNNVSANVINHGDAATSRVNVTFLYTKV